MTAKSGEPRPTPGRHYRFFRGLCRALVCAILTLVMFWAMLALWFDATRIHWLSGLLALLLSATCITLLFALRPLSRALLAISALLLLVIIWWNCIPARNNRDWMPDVARTAKAQIDGDRLTIENVRNFTYRSETDFTERWETRTYDLSRLQGADLFISFWGPTLIAHTIASWDFANAPPLAISIETRKEKGESYSALRGFFRQYELYYVVADERDVIGVRTNLRGERVYLYRIRIGPAAATALLLDYLKEINSLSQEPRWYNALTHNCTTSIRHHAVAVGANSKWDWRILANGRLDELGYEHGTINTTLPFPVMKARSEITQKAKAADSAPDFTARIRTGLPERPAPRTPQKKDTTQP